jgi:CRP-like cAMP-binding protein
MGVASKRADKKYLQDLVPLNALSESRFVQVARKIVIEEVRKGRYLFRKGNRDNESIYLLDGKINLIDGHRKVTSEVEAGTDVSRYPIANQQPRPLSARAVTRAVIARIDSGLLDVFLTWDQTSSTEVSEIGADDNKDWMTRILQSEAFIKIPPAIIQRLLLKMESVTVRAGKAVIKQGDEGDYFYTIHQGQCAVTRRENPDGDMLKLAELSEGDSFGEDALVSDARRNATVTMLSDGVLMRLAKKHFVELLQKHLISDIGYDAASTMVDSGAVWVDVRSSGEYTAGAFEDSVNIPLSDLRGELPELVFNVKYIICCDTGRRSSSAAFILSHKGYEVYVLDGGMNGLDEGFAAAADTTRDAGVTPEHDQPGADSVDIRDARESSDTDDQTSRFAEAPTGNAVPTANPAAEQLEEITELRRENTALRQAGIAHEDSVRNLADREVDVERLENALREAQQQQQAELGEARREAAARLDDLVTTLHEQQQLAGQLRAEQDGLRAELQQSRQNTGELEAGIAAARDAEVADTTQHNSELDTLRGELELSRQENTILVDRRADADRGVDELRQQLSDMGTGKEAEREDQQQLNAALQQEVDAGSLARQELQQQLEALQETYNNDQERLNTTASEHETVSARLQETEQQHDALHAENHQLERRGCCAGGRSRAGRLAGRVSRGAGNPAARYPGPATGADGNGTAAAGSNGRA